LLISVLYHLSKYWLPYRDTISRQWYCSSTSKTVNICYVAKNSLTKLQYYDETVQTVQHTDQQHD